MSSALYVNAKTAMSRSFGRNRKNLRNQKASAIKSRRRQILQSKSSLTRSSTLVENGKITTLNLTVLSPIRNGALRISISLTEVYPKKTTSSSILWKILNLLQLMKESRYGKRYIKKIVC